MRQPPPKKRENLPPLTFGAKLGGAFSGTAGGSFLGGDRERDPSSAVRATSGASTKRRSPAVILDHDAVKDVLAVVVEHLVDLADHDFVRAVYGRAALERGVVDAGAVFNGHRLEEQ